MTQFDTGSASSPAGSWPSDITPALVASTAPSIDYPCADADMLYWLETRPAENGRGVVVRRTPDGTQEDLLPAPLNARSHLHEYGGRPYCVHDSQLYFCQDDDQRIWTIDLTGGQRTPSPLTPDNGSRYAELCVDKSRNRLLAVCESPQPDAEPRASIVAIPLAGSQQLTELVQGADFYAFPRLSPDGTRLAWISWHHPHMPWDHTELWCATLDGDGTLCDARQLAGHQPEAVFQPEWRDESRLLFVSDRDEWWNLYQCDLRNSEVAALLPMEAEFATPLWTLGMSTLAVSKTDDVYCAWTRNGQWHLGQLSFSEPSGPARWKELPGTATQWHGLASTSEGFLVVGAAPDHSATLYHWRQGNMEAVRDPGPLPVAPTWISHPQPSYFPTTDGSRVHALYYPPTHPERRLREDEQPPLIVIGHGGPTGAASTALNYKLQFWTSRGFAVLDVNYRGSTGFGRSYRNALRGLWGVADVDDLCSGATHLVDQGIAHADKLIVRGSSAGGFTVLCALAFRDVFKAGASLYGIGDLETLARDTHKFESRYLDGLIGPWPEERERYRQRSPLYHSEGIRCPVIFFQGLDDKVVPPAQAEDMVTRLRQNGTPVAYLPIAGEAHGFRRIETLHWVLQAELAFYGRVFDFLPPGIDAALTIDNL